MSKTRAALLGQPRLSVVSPLAPKPEAAPKPVDVAQLLRQAAAAAGGFDYQCTRLSPLTRANAAHLRREAEYLTGLLQGLIPQLQAVERQEQN